MISHGADAWFLVHRPCYEFKHRPWHRTVEISDQVICAPPIQQLTCQIADLPLHYDFSPRQKYLPQSSLWVVQKRNQRQCSVPWHSINSRFSCLFIGSDMSWPFRSYLCYDQDFSVTGGFLHSKVHFRVTGAARITGPFRSSLDSKMTQAQKRQRQRRLRRSEFHTEKIHFLTTIWSDVVGKL